MLREVVTYEWFTILFLVCLSVLAFAKYAFSNRFSDFTMVIGNSRYLKIYAREQKFIDFFDGLLFVNLIISLAVFCFISYSSLVEPLQFDLVFLGKLTFGIGSVLLIKILIERLIGSVFEIDKVIDDYLFQKINYKNYIGLLLLPANILLIYALNPTKLLIYIVIAIIIMVNLVGFFTTIKTYQKSILDNLFYFILYLCALEIGPYMYFI